MRLPFAARVLLRLTDPRVREYLAGDLEESFAALAATEGLSRARRWSRRQALAAALEHPWKPVAAARGRGDGVMRTLVQDLSFGVRMVRRQPAFSLVVVVTLALAIGANAVIFSFADVFLLRPLPIRDSGTLAWIFELDPHTGSNRGLLSIPAFLDYRRSLTSFGSLGASVRASSTLTGRGEARRLQAMRVTANLIDLWGLRTTLGRGFTAGSDLPGARAEVVISHHYWDREMNRDPAIVGQTLTLDGRPTAVMGVLAPDIEIGGFSEIDVWTPLALDPDGSREERILRVSGRLKPGATLAQAGAELQRVGAILAREHPSTNDGAAARIATTREALMGTHTFEILTLLSLVVGFVLLLACANLANLVLSRATARRRELAVRSALGASRVRLVRQMLTESVIHGVCGGALGLGVAYGGLAIMRALAYEPFFQLVRIDRNVLLFTAALALVTPVLFAILPAMQATRRNSGDALTEGGARTAGGIRSTRSRSILVVTQLALAVMLLIVATLLVHSLVNIGAAPLGVDARRLLTARFELPSWRYPDAAAMTDYQNRLLARLRAIPAIENAALSDRIPVLDEGPVTEVLIEGRATPRKEDRPWAATSTVSDSYFATADLPILAGRGFTPDDRTGRPAVALVNREMARRYWIDERSAVGARLTLAEVAGAIEIVGVAADVRRADREAVNPQIYLSSAQRPRASLALLVRANDPAAIAALVRGEMRSLDADVPLYQVRPLQQALDEELSSSRILGSMFVSFALLALVLATSGLYAVVSYATAQRAREFGVRVALGAMPSDIVRMMLGQTGKLIAIGLGLGLAGGRVLAIGATSLLYQVSPSDAATYAGVAVSLGMTALLATYLPVRRAIAMDPVRALRLD